MEKTDRPKPLGPRIKGLPDYSPAMRPEPEPNRSPMTGLPPRDQMIIDEEPATTWEARWRTIWKDWAAGRQR